MTRWVYRQAQAEKPPQGGFSACFPHVCRKAVDFPASCGHNNAYYDAERRRCHAAVHTEFGAIPAGRGGAGGAAPSAAAALAQTGPAAAGGQRPVLSLHGRRAVGHSAAGAVSAGHTPPLSAHGVRALPRSAPWLRQRAAAAAAQCADDHPLWLSLAAGTAAQRTCSRRGRGVPAQSVHRTGAASAPHRPHRRHHRPDLQHRGRTGGIRLYLPWKRALRGWM